MSGSSGAPVLDDLFGIVSSDLPVATKVRILRARLKEEVARLERLTVEAPHGVWMADIEEQRAAVAQTRAAIKSLKRVSWVPRYEFIGVRDSVVFFADLSDCGAGYTMLRVNTAPNAAFPLIGATPDRDRYISLTDGLDRTSPEAQRLKRIAWDQLNSYFA